MWYYYINEDKEIMFFSGSGKLLGPFNEISILFDYNIEKDVMSTLCKHGFKDIIQKEFSLSSKLNFAMPDTFNFMMYTFERETLLSNTEIIEDLNNCISTTGYIDKFIKKYQLV